MGTGNERDTITCETVGAKFQSERDRRNKGKPNSIKAFFCEWEELCFCEALPYQQDLPSVIYHSTQQRERESRTHKEAFRCAHEQESLGSCPNIKG